MSFISNITAEIAKQQTVRIENEVMGAWMAGYDYLHHARRSQFHPQGAKERFYPSNSEKPKKVHRKYDSSWMVKTYDLRWLFPQDVAAIKEDSP